MTHKIDRQLKGISEKLNGYVLDNPDRDPTNEIKHHIYCMDSRKIFILTKRVYDEVIKLIDQNRKNDRHRIEDAAFKTGDYIVFTYSQEHGERHDIVDFELAENPMDLLNRNGKDVFYSNVVFNKKLNRVISGHFGYFDVDPQEIKKLNMIPTPNVVLKCFLTWKMTPDLVMRPRVMEIEKLEPDDDDFAFKADWNRSSVHGDQDSEDDDVMIEEKEIDKISAIRDKKGFITGLTSVYIPDMHAKTVISPLHNLRTHFVGRETINLDIVFNEIHKCFIILDHRPRISTHYHTLISRTPDDVQGLFYVDVQTADNHHGFYKHKQFNLIADPYGYLDTVFFGAEKSNCDFRTVFTVPIKDRLGKVHDSRSIKDLEIITRFEIVSPGDDQDQISKVEECRAQKTTCKRLYGIVINAMEGRVLGYTRSDKLSDKINCHRVNFILSPGHSFSNGDHICFEAERIVDPDIMKPTFKVLNPILNSTGKKVCVFKNGWFFFTAIYNEKYECYEAYPLGLVPCKKPPPIPTKRNAKLTALREVIIRAKENRKLPGQTIFCHGEFDKEI